jgi:ribonuclease HIII
LKLRRGAEQVNVNIYTTGKVLVQGKQGLLLRELQGWSTTAGEVSGTTTGLLLPLPHIGADESGKGDYFGPLVVAAVALDEQGAARLHASGVRDSKTLDEAAIVRLAHIVRACCAHAVNVLLPEVYNRRYQAVGANLNRLLAALHAETLAKLAEQVPHGIALVDQFGNAQQLEQAVAAQRVRLKVVQRPQAEADLAVAAASIVARDGFLDALRRLGDEVGVRLPLGASDTKAIAATGRRVVAQGGQAGLARVAKLHFKTTRLITSAYTGDANDSNARQ